MFCQARALRSAPKGADYRSFAIITSMAILLLGCGGGGAGGGEVSIANAATNTLTSASAPLVRCDDDPKNSIVGGKRDAAAYLTQPATQVVCQQTVLDSTFSPYRNGKTYIGGFAGAPVAVLTELSPYDATGSAFDRNVYTSKSWDESGTVGDPGELWWGRQGSDSNSIHIAVGQQSWVRYFYQLFKTDAAAAGKLRLGELSPFPTTSEMRYEQIGSTKPTYSGGSGGLTGRGPVLPGAVSGAVLVMTPVKPINGVLTMNIEVDGHTLQRTVPLQANVNKAFPTELINPDKVWSLKAAPAVGSSADCTDNGQPSADCFFPAESPTSGQRRYQAYTQFFGTAAEYAVVRFSMNVDSPPEKFTTNSRGEGVVVLKRVR